MINLISKSKAVELIKKTNGRIFSAEFIKKDGTVRLMDCRLGVKKGVTGKGMHYNPFKKGLIPVFEMLQINHEPGDKHFRMINVETLVNIRINKTFYTVAP